MEHYDRNAFSPMLNLCDGDAGREGGREREREREKKVVSIRRTDTREISTSLPCTLFCGGKEKVREAPLRTSERLQGHAEAQAKLLAARSLRRANWLS